MMHDRWLFRIGGSGARIAAIRRVTPLLLMLPGMAGQRRTLEQRP
jgi:hypothetical protein